MEQSTSELVTNLIKDGLCQYIENIIGVAGQIIIPVLISVIISAIVWKLVKRLLNAIFRVAGFSEREAKKCTELITGANDLMNTLK